MEITKITPTEYDMLLDDQDILLSEMDEHRKDLIRLESELQVVRNKISFIEVAVPNDVVKSSYQ